MSEDLTTWRVLVGRVKGRWDHSNLRIIPFTEVKEYFQTGSQLCFAPTNGPRRVLTIRESRLKDKQWVCDVNLLATEEAEALIGSQVFVHPSARPALPEGEFYLDDIFGMRVVTEAGEDLGTVHEILESPAHNIYVTKKAMIPAHADFILETDWENRVLKVKDVKGLTGAEE
jgi:16S rRNA processing protein RimM